jgi:hypothetical protein
MRYIELSEKRRGGKDNPKVDIFLELKKYLNSGEHYISYVVIDKLGINPRSGYATPIGIYSYPTVEEVLKPILSTSDLNRAPFMGDAPYIFLFKPKRIDRGLYLSDYRDSDYSADVKKLREYMSSRDDRFIGDVFDKVEKFARSDAKVKDASGWIWNLTRLLARLLSGEDVLSVYTVGVLGYGDRVIVKGGNDLDNIRDSLISGAGIDLGKVGEIVDVYKDSDEYGVRVPLRNGGYDEIYVGFDDVVPVPVIDSKYSKLLDELSNNIGIGVNATNPNASGNRWELFNVDKRYGIITVRNRTSGNEFPMSIIRFLRANTGYSNLVNESLLEYQAGSKKANRSAVLWTHLLYRVLGYDFIDDSYGSKLIHDNEPYQAVFFNRGVIDIVDRFENPQSSGYTLTFDKLFSGSSMIDINKISISVINDIFRKELKKISVDGLISQRMSHKFMGNIPITNSRLQAALILADFGMVDFIKKINNDAIAIMDSVMLERIRALDAGDIGMVRRITPILRYFRLFHSDGWDIGERVLIDHAIRIGDPAILLSYLQGVHRVRNSEMDRFILDNVRYIGRYAKVFGNRWLAGERELLKLDRSSWIVKEYLDIFGIEYSDLGKL